MIISRFTIIRTGPTDEALEVSFRWGGTALKGLYKDYSAVASPRMIPAGESSIQVTIYVRTDSLIEGLEYVTLEIRPVDGYSVANPPDNIARIDILDNTETSAKDWSRYK